MAGIKLKASSILEVVVSMVVIVAVFSIAMGIFANVQRLSLSAKRICAQSILTDLVLTDRSSFQIGKQISHVGDFNIEQEITIYHDNAGLFQISLSAYDANGEKITELKEVVPNDQ